jgi:hypothetical protein
MLFPLIESIDVRQIDGFGLAHFVRRPILDGVTGRSLHRVLDDSGRRIWLRKTLTCKQVYTSKQTKKDRANQGQLDASMLS